MVFLTPVNRGQGSDHSQREEILLRQSLTKQSSQLVRPGGSPPFSLALRGALFSLFSFANETL